MESNNNRKDTIKELKEEITGYNQEIMALLTAVKELKTKKEEAEKKVKDLEQEKTDKQTADSELDAEIKEAKKASEELKAQILVVKNELGLSK